MDEPRWKLIERLVAILEKAITPSARVKHNVSLPVLGRPNRKPRQCDIVITCGDAPRETITIVEVQKRNKKPNITTFHGWIKKMQEVGAQHLICVSAQGYPKSIIDDVAMVHGPTVRLMTLQELERGIIPGMILSAPLIHRIPEFSFVSVSGIALENSSISNTLIQRNIELNTSDYVFSLDEEQARLSLDDLVAETLPIFVTNYFDVEKTIEPDEYEVELELGSVERTLWFHIDDQRYRIKRLVVLVKVKSYFEEIPLNVLSYKQEFYEGELAWLATAKGKVSGRDIEAHIIFQQDKEGFLVITSVQVVGAERLILTGFDCKEDFDAAMAMYRK
ncbi:MAG TPA: hypothetical protein VF571_04250 [Pyrinomonadaceae bacterium]|jgi:hypothetical protein